MSVWSWLTGGSKRTAPSDVPQDGASFPELIFLLRGMLPGNVEFIQGAIKHALGVSLASGKDDSEEFLIGEFPIYMFQFGGRLMQIKLIPEPLFNPKSRPLVTTDVPALLQDISKRGLRDLVNEHQCWLGVSFMRSVNPNRQGEDPYEFVGKMLGAFGFGDEVLAIVWPNRSEIRAWEPDSMMECLESGTPQQIFQ